MSTIGPVNPTQPVYEAGFVVERGGGLRPALVEQHDDRLDAVLAPELARVAVRGRGLVEEAEVGDAGRRDDARRPFERHADEADLLALEAADHVGPEQRLGVVLADHVGGEELEVRPLERVAGLAAVVRVAAAALHALELVFALVELVVADRVEVEPEQVHGLDRGLVVVERRHERARADQVARRDQSASCACRARARARSCRGSRRRRRAGSSARRGGWRGLHGRRVEADAAGRGRLEVAVEVVEGQQLDLDVLGLVVVMRACAAAGAARTSSSAPASASRRRVDMRTGCHATRVSRSDPVTRHANSATSCGPTHATEASTEIPRAISVTRSSVVSSSRAIDWSGSMSSPNTTVWLAA